MTIARRLTFAALIPIAFGLLIILTESVGGPRWHAAALAAAAAVLTTVVLVSTSGASRRTEEALQSTEEEVRRLARFPEENPNPVVRVALDGTVLYRNAAAAGTPSWRCEAGGRLPHETLERLAAQAVESSRGLEEDVELNGAHFAIAVVPVPEDGYVNFYGRDISGRKRMEEALRHAKDEWERTFDTVPDLIAILDMEHRIVRVNRAMARRAGLSPEQCAGRPCYEIVHGTDGPPPFCPLVMTRRDGGEHTVEVHEDRLGGDFLVTTVPLTDAGGHRVGVVHLARDISERKQAEEALRRSHDQLERRVAERTAELQRLARELTRAEEHERYRIAQVLHDDLQQVLAYATLRTHCLKQPDKAAEHPQAAQDVMDALSAAIRTCRNMSHDLHPHRTHAAGLPAGLLHVAAQARERFALDIRTEIDEQADAELPEELRLFAFRAAAELLFNCAKHAGTGRALLTLDAREDEVRVSVRDEGAGFDPAAYDVGGGAAESFGLSTLARRARFLGGELRIDSAPGRGTGCLLQLPRRPIPDNREPNPAGAPDERVAHGGRAQRQ